MGAEVDHHRLGARFQLGHGGGRLAGRGRGGADSRWVAARTGWTAGQGHAAGRANVLPQLALPAQAIPWAEPPDAAWPAAAITDHDPRWDDRRDVRERGSCCHHPVAHSRSALPGRRWPCRHRPRRPINVEGRAMMACRRSASMGDLCFTPSGSRWSRALAARAWGWKAGPLLLASSL
jgi:hypothetical protein